MSQPVPAMTQLFRTSLRAWQARWKAAQDGPAPEPLPAETSTASAQQAQPATKVQRQRNRGGRMAHGPIAKRA